MSIPWSSKDVFGMRCWIALFLSLFSVCAPAAAGAENFRNPHRLALPFTPDLLLHGDLNGDGLDDLVYADPNARIVYTLLNQGGGRYLPGPTLKLPTNVYDACRIGDFNGDHRLDLACNYSYITHASMVFFPGQGDGSFGPPTYVPLPDSSALYFYLGLTVAGDLNGDGVPDLIAVDGQNVRSWPILSDGRGGFTVGAQTTANYLATYLDVNGDGKLDALEVGPSVALGNGDGTFGAFHTASSSPGYYPCAFGDLDGDGHPDAACTHLENTQGTIAGAYDLLVYHGNPDGSFDAAPELKQVYGDRSSGFEGFGTVGVPIAIADMNGDGIADIITSAPDGTTIFYGQPGLTFAPPRHFATGSVAPYTYFVADSNGDGLPDFVALGENGIYFSYGKPDGSLETAPAYEVTGIISYAVTADFNGDGIPDIIASGDNHLAISLGKGDGTFLPYRNLDTGAVHFNGYNTAMVCRVVHGDFNGDGKEDLLASGAADTYSLEPHVYYLQGNGDGTFQKPVQVGSGTDYFGMYDVLRTVDLNGDGRSDFVRAPDINSGTLSVQISNGDGTFTTKSSPVPTESYGNGSPFFWPETVPAAADFDGDGKLDLVTAARANVYVLHGNGDGTFTPGATLAIPQLAVFMGDARSVATGDFDGDGHADVAVLWGSYTTGGSGQNYPETETVIFYGRGDGTFSAPVVAETGNNGFAFIDAADLNNDGRDEIVLRAAGTLNGGTDVAVLHGQPNRSFLPEDDYVAGAGLSSLDIVDLNHDGFRDLVFANGDYNGHGSSVTVLMNLGNTPTVSGALQASPEPSVTGAPVTLTVSLVAPDASALGGSVRFSIDGIDAGSATLTHNLASLPVPGALGIGTHALAASWPGNSAFGPVTLLGSHTVTGLATVVTLSADLSAVTIGQPLHLTATVADATSDPAGSAPPTGSVAISSGSLSLASGGAQSSTGVSFSTAATFSAAGAQTITASYGGDATHARSTATLVVTVDALPTVTSVSLSPEPSTYGQPVSFVAHVSGPNGLGLLPSGTVQFTFCRGATVSVTLNASGDASFRDPLPNTIAVPVGVCSVTATYQGDAHFASSSSAAAPYIVNPAASSTALTASPNPVLFSHAVTFGVTVNGVVSPVADPVTGLTLPPAQTAASGSVQLLDGGTLLGGLVLSASRGTFSTSTLAVGTHTITAVFPGDPNLGGSTSAPLTLTVLPCDSSFSIHLTPSTLTLKAGSSATASVTLQSSCAFAGNLVLSAGTLPPQSTISFSPATVTLAASTSSGDTLTFDTRTTTTSASSGRRAPLALAALLLVPLAVWRRRRLASLLILFASTTLLLSVTGCRDVFYYIHPVSPGTYTIPISATDSTTHTTQTTTLTVTILP